MAIGKKLRWEVFRRDNFACRYCGRTARDGAVLEVDHVTPRSHRGIRSAPCEHCETSEEPEHAACRWHTKAFRGGRMTRAGDGAVASLRDVQPFSVGQEF